MKLLLLVLWLSLLQANPEFDCWTVAKTRHNPGGGWQVCTSISYL